MNKAILSIRQQLALKLLQRSNSWQDEHKLPGGKLEGKVYIIRRSGKKLGLFSYFETIIPRIDYAVKNNMIPVVDMCNFDNSLKENDEHNPWEDYFEQPYDVSLENAYRSKQIILSDSGIPEKRPNESMDYFEDKGGKLTHWRECCRKYVRLKPDVRQYIDNKKKVLFEEDDVILGVLARGTDYISLKPSGHPVQPSGEQILEKVKATIEDRGYTKVFLATEDKEIAALFRKELGDICVTGDKEYVDYKEGFLADNKANTKQRTLDYLSNIVILAECQGIVAGRTSGTVGAAMLTDGWKETYFFDLGLYE